MFTDANILKIILEQRLEYHAPILKHTAHIVSIGMVSISLAEH